MTKNKTIAAVAAGALAVIALLFAVPNPAGASNGNGRATMPANIRAKKVTMTDYGSGIYTGTTSPVVRTGDPATADYTLFGDSILVRCTSKIQAAMAAKGKTAAFIGQSSQNTKGLVDLLLATPSIGGKVVMEAGTNSVFSPPEVAAQIARAQTWTADNGVELFWGDTYVGRPNTINADLRNSGWVNSFIYSAMPYDHVIKWQAAISAAVGRGGMDMIDYYIQDGVHPFSGAGPGHGDGCAFLAAVYVAGLGL
jgi:hypothetical protein